MKCCAFKLKISACRKNRRHRRKELPKSNDVGRQGSMRTWLSMKTLTPTRCVKNQMVTQDSNTTWISLMKTETERRRGLVMTLIAAVIEIDTAMSMIANMMMSTTVRKTQMAYSTEMKMALFVKVEVAVNVEVVSNVVVVAASVVNVAAIVAKTAEKIEETGTA